MRLFLQTADKFLQVSYHKRPGTISASVQKKALDTQLTGNEIIKPVMIADMNHIAAAHVKRPAKLKVKITVLFHLPKIAGSGNHVLEIWCDPGDFNFSIQKFPRGIGGDHQLIAAAELMEHLIDLWVGPDIMPEFCKQALPIGVKLKAAQPVLNVIPLQGLIAYLVIFTEQEFFRAIHAAAIVLRVQFGHALMPDCPAELVCNQSSVQVK